MAGAQRALPTAGISLAVVGLILLIFEVVWVVGGHTLGTLGGVLLWVGVGFVAIGMLLIAWTLLGLPSTETAAYAGSPAEVATATDEPVAAAAPPVKTAAPSTPPPAPAAPPTTTQPTTGPPPASTPAPAATTTTTPAAPATADDDADLGGEG